MRKGDDGLCQTCLDTKNVVYAQPKTYDDFVNLHLHTAYSLLDGMSRPEDVVKKVASLRQKAFAVTEHGNTFSAVKVHKLAKEENLKHIFGAEFYITENRFVKNKDKKYYHLTVLAKNEQGRLNINKLATLGYLEGFYSKPRIDHELLKKHSEGLIILSGCMASELQQALAGGKIGDGDVYITENNINNAKGIIKWYREVFGQDYYLEVQAHRDYRQQKLNRAIVDLAVEMGIEYVATTDAHFVDEGDMELHSIFIQIGTNREAGETYEDCSIMSAEQVINKLNGSMNYEESERAVKTSLIIADKCIVNLPLSAPLIPHVEVPFGYNSEEDYLKDLCNQGWVQRGINKKPKEVQKIYKERLMYEFNAIKDMGFTGYYLLVYSYANSVEERGIARGSGGGSLVAYLVNIVDVDPIEYGLYFERFIDVGQLDLLKEGKIQPYELKIPDFDLDFSPNDREKVVQFIEDKYTKERFASLGQFGYIWDKSAIKDVGRVLSLEGGIYHKQLDFNILNNITKDLNDLSIEDAREEGYIQKWEKKYPQLFKYAEKLAGLPRSFGVHPCGKAITIDELTHYHAIAENEGHLVFQMDMDDAESLGLVKVDVLGLKTISIIFSVLKMTGNKYREYLDPTKLNFNDQKVYEEVFQKGFTDGVFQFESRGMKQTLQNMKPNNLEDLAVANALYRPGAMKYIDEYIKRKHGEVEVTYLHPDLEEILKPTYGIIVFQEQLISVGRLAKMRNPDKLRKATGKKIEKLMLECRDELHKGLVQDRGWTVEQFEQLWKDMLDFSKYSFNRSHSVAYAIIAFMCAYLKVYHPKEFVTSSFNAFSDKAEKFEGFYLEAKRLGIQVEPIKFESPTPYCTLVDDRVHYGLKLVKHCNIQMAESLSDLKDNHYEYFMDLLIDITEKTSIDSRQMNILIELDFFNKFGNKQLIAQLYDTFKNGKGVKYDKKYVAKTKEKRIETLRELETSLRQEFNVGEQNLYKQLEFEKEYYGFMRSTYSNVDENTFAIVEINDKYTPLMSLYNLKTGRIIKLKVKKRKFYDDMGIPYLYVGDVLRITGTSEEGKWYLDEEGQWKQNDSVQESYLATCKLLERNAS